MNSLDLNGLNMGLGNIHLLSSAKSYSISAENFTGEKGKGGMAIEGTGAKCSKTLGFGWKVSPCINIKPSETFTLAEIDGPGSVQSIWFGGNVGRAYIIRIYWDEQESPSVECPLSDFFAYGWVKTTTNATDGPFYQINSLPVVVNPNKGLNCFWPMPFRGKCRITIENRSEKEYSCFYQINYTLTEIPENAAYFHAQFRRTNPIPYKGLHTILDGVSGQGQYVGTALFIGLNGAGNWWGEGELKFYIDGDTDYPTICGTGTEDYFGGSYDWEVDGKYVTYSTPFMGMYQVVQSDGLYNHQQRFSMYRWHIMDPIRFEKDLKITIQDLGWTVPGERYLARQDDIATVSYWYQTLPTVKFPQLPDRDYLEII